MSDGPELQTDQPQADGAPREELLDAVTASLKLPVEGELAVVKNGLKNGRFEFADQRRRLTALERFKDRFVAFLVSMLIAVAVLIWHAASWQAEAEARIRFLENSMTDLKSDVKAIREAVVPTKTP